VIGHAAGGYGVLGDPPVLAGGSAVFPPDDG